MNPLKTTTLIAALTVLLSSCDKEVIIPASELPVEINSYITTHFSSNTILQVVKDRDGLTKTYDVILSDNLQLEFNRKKEIIAIDGTKRLPDSVIPEKIRQYVKTNYPSEFITGWELDNKNQQVQLNIGLELLFTMNGDFIRIDL